jgi:hypothetical protein
MPEDDMANADDEWVSWDQQIQRDFDSGKLNTWLDRVDADIAAGRIEKCRRPYGSQAYYSYWEYLMSLPEAIGYIARKKHGLWFEEPLNPSLRATELRLGLWSIYIDDGYRALARGSAKDLGRAGYAGFGIVWFWMGTRADYSQVTNAGAGGA